MRYPSGRAKSAKPTESFRGVLVRCPPWRALSLAVCCRSRLARRRNQRCETFRCFAQRRLEVSNTEAGQTALHPVYNARALTNDPLTLTVRALHILLRKRRNRCHVAVIWFTTQPADEDAFEQPGVESTCFRAAMLERYTHARRVHDVGFDCAGPY